MFKVLFFINLFFFGNVFANRYILVGARQSISNDQIQVLKTIEFDNQTYTVISSTTLDKNKLQRSFGDLEILEDIPLEFEDQELNKTSLAEPGWHIQRLRYQELDSRYQGQNIIVAVLDTGIDSSHTHLRNNIWVNRKEIPGNFIDDDKNGYIDDYQGWNFGDDNDEVHDEKRHGTHCAGIIAAQMHPRGIGVGVAPLAQVMNLKIISENGQSFLSDAAEAIVYATNHGAHILSNSWRIYKSWPQYNTGNLNLLRNAIKYAQNKGVLFVASAGNESRNITEYEDLSFPLRFRSFWNLIGVAAADWNGSSDGLAMYSNYGNRHVHFVAPGSRIFSTAPMDLWRLDSGSSMAAPLVSGVLARIMSKGYSGRQALEILKITSKRSSHPLWLDYVKEGYIDPISAINH